GHGRSGPSEPRPHGRGHGNNPRLVANDSGNRADARSPRRCVWGVGPTFPYVDRQPYAPCGADDPAPCIVHAGPTPITSPLVVGLLGATLAAALWSAGPSAVAGEDGKDWPMYNRDVIGTRHNRGETAIDKDNAGRLEEKWRFPARGSDQEIGVIHATPVVVD